MNEQQHPESAGEITLHFAVGDTELFWVGPPCECDHPSGSLAGDGSTTSRTLITRMNRMWEPYRHPEAHTIEPLMEDNSAWKTAHPLNGCSPHSVIATLNYLTNTRFSLIDAPDAIIHTMFVDPPVTEPTIVELEDTNEEQ